MAKETSGFITDDGVFFKTKEDAEYYEARRTLERVYKLGNFGALVSFGIWLDTLTTYAEDIKTYIEAFHNVQNLQQDEDAEKPAD